MTPLQRRIVTAVLVCHFVSAFTALGLPPFFGVILGKSFHSDEAYLVGWFYIVPALFAALAGPWWGIWADRTGKKRSLLRAQFGLSASFLLAGLSDGPWTFFLALILQGVLGGTFAASNAYLATVVTGARLSRCLTLTQGSARAALAGAPAVFGPFMAWDSPVRIYCYLALLPLAAALLLWRLPEGSPVPAAERKDSLGSAPGDGATFRLCALQFALIFATVVTFPYFIPFAQASFSDLTATLAGLLFGLPHLVYLLSAAPMSRRLDSVRPERTLMPGFILLAVSLIGQALAPTPALLGLGRLLMGLAMTACFIALHNLMAHAAHHCTAGRTFARLDSSSKWAGVAAGLAAGFVAQSWNLHTPFLLGAVVAIAALCSGGRACFPLTRGNT
jgi:MFS family permease